MSVRILEAGDIACMYDSVSMTAFGPVVYESEDDTAYDILNAFIHAVERKSSSDIRRLSARDLDLRWAEWVAEHQDSTGIALTPEEHSELSSD